MPDKTDIERRDRALVAFAILSGARDRAIISFRLKHIDIEHDLIEHDARDVRTKRAKTFTTWFFPVGDDIRHPIIPRSPRTDTAASERAISYASCSRP